MTGFDGIAVGVGTGKILGNIRIVSLTIGRYHSYVQDGEVV